jgi:glycosyltransferase involved in cell wall biosynthesis
VLALDDALALPPPDAGATPAARFRRNFEATAHAADLVLCGNTELARRVPHDRVEILPTAVDTARFAPGAAPPARGPALGWVGYAGNLRYLEAIAEPLREVARRHAGLRLIVVADRPPAIDGLEVEYRRWSLEREVADFGGIAVGLMPLPDDPWTRGKCAFKALQYMALGIPAVASPVGANREAIETGVSGFLPRDAREWVDALDALLSDALLAARVAAAGRRVVEEKYSLDVVSPRLVAILGRLVGSGPR